MWLLISKGCAYAAAGMIALRILRLVRVSVMARSGAEPSASERSRQVTADRVLRWGFYVAMAAALGAFAIHLRQR